MLVTFAACLYNYNLALKKSKVTHITYRKTGTCNYQCVILIASWYQHFFKLHSEKYYSPSHNEPITKALKKKIDIQYNIKKARRNRNRGSVGF